MINCKMFMTLMSFAAFLTASEYPSDYPLFTDCQELSYVRVCRSLQKDGGISLDITYSSWRLDSADPMKLELVVHNKDRDRSQTYALIKKSQVERSVRLTNGCLVGRLGGCAERATREMMDQLVWATDGMTLNELSLDISVFDREGTRDDRFGKKYPFWFPERGL